MQAIACSNSRFVVTSWFVSEEANHLTDDKRSMPMRETCIFYLVTYHKPNAKEYNRQIEKQYRLYIWSIRRTACGCSSSLQLIRLTPRDSVSIDHFIERNFSLTLNRNGWLKDRFDRCKRVGINNIWGIDKSAKFSLITSKENRL